MRGALLSLFLVFTFGVSHITAQEQVNLWVNGICGMCQDRIEKASNELTGVKSASWDIESKMLTLETDKNFVLDMIHIHLNSIGHDTKVSQATEEAYNTLHACCRYRDADVIGAHATDGKLEKSIVDNAIQGIIYEKQKFGKLVPVPAVTMYWEGTTAATSTDNEGFFTLPKVESSDMLVLQYVGYASDTIDLADKTAIHIILTENHVLDEVRIVYRKKSSAVSMLNTQKVRNISQKELQKAACCNLSESFETTPSVDISFTDAVTGTRKVELLGLAGPYVQVMRENIPYIRGLSSLNGFTFTPGSWIQSMQLNMGAASVVNGPEAMTGQINVEVKKPNSSEQLYVNAYFNEMQRTELSINGATKVNPSWNTAYLVHGNLQQVERDRNNDGFLDLPLNERLIAMNRWKFSGKNGLNSQFGIKGTYMNSTSGQLSTVAQSENRWQANMLTERMEAWFKMGKVLQNKPNTSIGFQLMAVNHNQESNFGLRVYDATQQSVYANLMYQTTSKDANHAFKAGTSLQYDKYDELVQEKSYLRNEILPGIYGEYNYVGSDKWSVIAGLRADYHNIFGLYVTPRLHLKYGPNETTAFRIVAGKGQRTASVFAENVGMFASNREIVFVGADTDSPYGLDQEIAWNAGFNVTKEFSLLQRSLVFGVDYYYTYFENQIVIDYDHYHRGGDFEPLAATVSIYNLDGQSFSHSVQTQLDYEVLPKVDLRLAYRFNDVKAQQIDGLLQKALISRHRAFMNIGWEITETWKWDGTINYQGTKRIPFAYTNYVNNTMPEDAPSFFTINTQFSKAFKKGIEIYFGAENLLDYRQTDAIISADDVLSKSFDSSLVWGPVSGRNVYIGARYKLEK